jgi:hypothetical protein
VTRDRLHNDVGDAFDRGAVVREVEGVKAHLIFVLLGLGDKGYLSLHFFLNRYVTLLSLVLDKYEINSNILPLIRSANNHI